MARNFSGKIFDPPTGANPCSQRIAADLARLARDPNQAAGI
jgi:hypothetical protein